MIGTTLNRSSEARDSKVRSLAFFLGLSVLAHGLFFPQEWLWLAAGLAFTLSWEAWRRVKNYGAIELSEIQGTLSITDGLLFLLIAFSLLGLGHPVKHDEGWMDALRWGTLWMVYHQSSKIVSGREQEKMLSWIERIGVFLAILVWLGRLSLWVQGQEISQGSERFASLLGYSNALGVYLAAILLLRPRSKIVQALLLITLINTGSRAAICLFLIVWAIRGWTRWRTEGILLSLREGTYIGVTTVFGLILTLAFNPGALQHLLDWGIQNSLGERLLYVQDGLKLAWAYRGIPQAGGWLAFPVAQSIPYWTTDPHSLLIRVLLNQGVLGLLALILWVIAIFRQIVSRRRMRVEGLDLLGREQLKKRQGVFWTLLFLGLHAAIDVDFLFGTLGILFWILIGMVLPHQDRNLRVHIRFRNTIKKTRLSPSFSEGRKSLVALMLKKSIKPKVILTDSKIKDFKRNHSIRLFLKNLHLMYLKNILQGLLFIFLGLALLGTRIYPQALESTKTLSQEMEEVEGNKQRSLEILEESLSKDQTQFKVRREIASLELELKGAAGLEAAEHVLTWEKFNIRTYEWIQGRVLEEAEKRRSTDPSEALLLYQWCENLPMRLDEVAAVSPFEQRVWPEAVNFKSSELMKLFAATAKERQLTLP